jgi:hypothetical protein
MRPSDKKLLALLAAIFAVMFICKALSGGLNSVALP